MEPHHDRGPPLWLWIVVGVSIPLPLGIVYLAHWCNWLPA